MTQADTYTVTFTPAARRRLDKLPLAYKSSQAQADLAAYAAGTASWVQLPGQFTVQVGRSSRDLPLTLPVRIG